MRTIIIGLYLLTFIQHIFAQTEAQIIDNRTKEPLIGVHIQVANSERGTISNREGRFSILLKDEEELKISYLGYQTKHLKGVDIPKIILLEQDVAEVSQVIVSASRTPQNRSDAAVSISTLTPKIIEETRAKSLDEILNKASGVFMVNLGNEQHSMAIRQPLSYKSLFLYLEDGLPIRPTSVFNHNALIEMDQAAIQQIEIIRGPSSSIYGSEAIGGAINFITQKPTAIPTASLLLQANNLGFIRTNLRTAGMKGKFGWAASGQYSMRRNGVIEHSDYNKLGLSLKLTYTASKKDFFEFHSTLADYKSDMTGSLDSLRFYEGDYSSVQTFTNRDVWALRSRLSYKRFWNDASQTQFLVFTRDNSIKQIPSYRVRDDYSPWGNPMGDSKLAHGENNDNSFQSYGLLIQHLQKLKFWNTAITSGLYLDYSPNSYIANYISIDKDENGIYTDYYNHTDSMLTNYNVGLLNPAAYLRLESSPFKNFKIIAGLRFDAFVYDYKNNLSENAFSGAPNNVDQFNAITPKLGLTYTFLKNSGVYANFSQGFVPPQISELYRAVSVPSLKPATYNNFELGSWIRLFENKLNIDLSLYQMNGFNEIISIRLDNGDFVNQNAGKTLHRGIEYGISYSPLKDISIRFSGANAQHLFVDYVEQGNNYSGNSMPQAPAWLLNTEITYRPRQLKGFRIGVEMQRMSSYYMNAANSQPYEGFTIFNARTAYQYRGIECFVNLMNFTNQLYSPNASQSRWGQTYTLGAPININIGLGYHFAAKNKTK